MAAGGVLAQERPVGLDRCLVVLLIEVPGHVVVELGGGKRRRRCFGSMRGNQVNAAEGSDYACVLRERARLLRFALKRGALLLRALELGSSGCAFSRSGHCRCRRKGTKREQEPEENWQRERRAAPAMNNGTGLRGASPPGVCHSFVKITRPRSSVSRRMAGGLHPFESRPESGRK